MVTIVCLGRATILAPSMFGTQLLSDFTNVFHRGIYVGDVQQGNPQDYLGGKNDACYNQCSTNETDYRWPTNKPQECEKYLHQMHQSGYDRSWQCG